MAKHRIMTDDEQCTGCLRCQLACSFSYTKSFNPSAARVHIDFFGVECSIRFTEDCVSCGLCADNCFYGALQSSKEGEAG